ncbi:unnamed protein product, partial [Ectocarpus fasciculatus]
DGGIGASASSGDGGDEDDGRELPETSSSTSKGTGKRQLVEAGKAAEGKAREDVNAGNRRPASVGSGDTGADTRPAKAEKKKKRAKGKRRRYSDDEAGGSAPPAGGREPGKHSRPTFDEHEDGRAAAGGSRDGGAAVVGSETSASVGSAEDLGPGRQAKRELPSSVKKKKKKKRKAAVAVPRGAANGAEGDGSGGGPAVAQLKAASEGTGSL